MTDLVRPSSQRKHAAMLAAAEVVFLRDGYLAANMDELATVSGVSKQTVYKHFGSKEALFVELVSSMTSIAGDGLHRDDVPDLPDSATLPSILQSFAEQQLAIVLTPRLLRLRRLVIGEVGRFPDLARVLWERGPDRAISSLTQRFARLSRAGLLRLDDPRMAAEHFNWLAMSGPLNAAMLLGDDAVPDPAALRRHSAEAVRIFLAAYGAPPAGD